MARRGGKKKGGLARLLLAGPTFGLSLRGKRGKLGKPKSEPGYVTEARQSIRGLMTPEGFAEALRKNLEALGTQYAPYFKNLRQQTLNNIQQRVIAGQPAGLVGVSGPEVYGLGQAGNQFDANQQAYLTNLALGNIGTEANIGEFISSGRTTPPGYISGLDTINQFGGLAGDLLKKLLPGALGKFGIPGFP